MPAPTEVGSQRSGDKIGSMGDFILAGVLTWLTIFVWWGTDLVLRARRREKVVGGLLIAVGLVPSLIALWLGT